MQGRALPQSTDYLRMVWIFVLRFLSHLSLEESNAYRGVRSPLPCGCEGDMQERALPQPTDYLRMVWCAASAIIFA